MNIQSNYYDRNGQKNGPIPSSALKSLAQQGSVTPDTIVETEDGRRTTAGNIKGLLFTPSATVPPVVPLNFPPVVPQNFEPPSERLSSIHSARRAPSSGGVSVTKTDHEKFIDYFTKKGCLGRMGVFSDNAYDQMVMDKVNSLNLKNKAMASIGLDIDQLREVPPVFLHGYSFEPIDVRFPDELSPSAGLMQILGGMVTIPGVASTYWRIGTDGRLRSSKYDAAWLFFSNTQVYTYKYTLDMTSDSMKETIGEYFYKDITNFSTEFQSVSPPRRSGGCEKKMCGCLNPSVVRESIMFRLIVPNDDLTCSMSGVANAERSVQAAKQLMRERKG